MEKVIHSADIVSHDLNYFFFVLAAATQQTRNVIVTFSIGFKLVTLNLTFGKRLANVYVLCRHIFDV